MDYKKYFKSKFAIHELVSKDVYVALGEAAWNLIDPTLMYGAGWLRWRYDKDNPDAVMTCESCTINNYFWGGQFNWSGARTPNSPNWSEGSQHSIKNGKLCTAFDMKFKGLDAEDIRNDLRDYRDVPFITRVEDDVPWIHIDCKPTNNSNVYFFKP